jgi:molybdopterin-containing oxidoreductase family molybdopterin binding subunit
MPTALNRRSFLKGVALTATLTTLAVFGNSLLVPAASSSIERKEKEVKVFCTACAPNCWQNCRLYAYVVDGKLVKTAMAPMPNRRYDRICLRGLSHVQRVYDPNRLKYPLKRVGKRGEGKWVRISWEEAINTIAQKLLEIKERYGPQAIMFSTVSGNYGLVNGSFCGAIKIFANIFEGTIVEGGVDSALPLGLSQVIANIPGGSSAFFGANEAADIADNTRLIIMWGANFTESQIQSWHFIADALENGAKMVTIDPRMSIVAAKSDIWLKPRPGSDPALALSMIYTILNEGLYDKKFVTDHTVAPFLVRLDNGLFLREKDVNPNGGDKYVVWDEGVNAPVPYDQAKAPALYGKYEVKGIPCKPALQLLWEEASKYKPEDAEAITDVPAEEVKEVARLYATRKPACIIAGFGVDRWDNGHLTGRALATLAALTGNIGKPGAMVGGLYGGSALMAVLSEAWRWVTPSGTEAHALNPLLAYDAIAYGYIEKHVPKDPKDPLKGTVSKDPTPMPYTIKAAVISCTNFANTYPNQKWIIEKLFSEENLEFIVVIEQKMNDTAMFADIVLPATTWFENDDLMGGLHPYLMIQERAIQPLYECKSDWEIFKMIAEKMGLGQYFQGSESDQRERILAALKEAFGEEKIRTFRETGVARISKEPYIGYEDGNYPTQSGRIEFYSERVILNYPWAYPALGIPVTMGVNPLPHFNPPVEAWPDNPLTKKYPLVLIQQHSKWRVHSQWYEAVWLRELDPEPYVEMNPKDAEARGIKNGDVVNVFNDRGWVRLKAKLNPSLRPGLVNIDKGWQRSQFAAGSYDELTAAHKNPITLNCSFFDTLVEVQKA